MPNERQAPTPKAQRDAAARAAREAEALRANLLRRKAQSRARETPEPRKAPE